MIQEKLQKARFELLSKKLKKSGKNGYSGFTYYELADFIPQVTEIFYNLKIFSNFSIDEGKAFLTVTDWEDKTSEVFKSPIEDLELKGCTKIQALGGVHTYMKRYLYLNALEITENDMFDAKAGVIEEKKPQNNDFIPDVIKNQENELADLDIFEGLKATSDSKSALKYFNEYREVVNDKIGFRKAWQEHIKTFKETA